jgi:hypothetical protein
MNSRLGKRDVRLRGRVFRDLLSRRSPARFAGLPALLAAGSPARTKPAADTPIRIINDHNQSRYSLLPITYYLFPIPFLL